MSLRITFRGLHVKMIVHHIDISFLIKFMKTEYDLTQDDLREFIYYDIQNRYKKLSSEEM